MKISEMQEYLKTRILAHPQLAGNTVLFYRGKNWDNWPAREKAISGKGLVFIVWKINSVGLVEKSDTGVSNQYLSAHVIIQENDVVNHSAKGTKIPIEDAVEYVMQAISGYPKGRGMGVAPSKPFILADDPWNNLGVVNGVSSAVVNFTKLHSITPI